MSLFQQILLPVGLDVEAWRKLYHDDNTLKAVLEDFKLASSYDISSVPTLVIDGKHQVQGAQPLKDLENAFKRIAEAEHKSLNKAQNYLLYNRI